MFQRHDQTHRLTLRSFRSFAVSFGFAFFAAPPPVFKIPTNGLLPLGPVAIVVFAYDTSVASANVWLSSRSRADRSAASAAARRAS